MSTYDDDAFWDALAPLMFAPEKLQHAAADAASIARLIGLPAQARVLDHCCGAGAHAIELARRGYVVTGVDRTHAYLARARKAAQDAGVDVEWVEADVRSFTREASFDAAINLSTSFGCF